MRPILLSTVLAPAVTIAPLGGGAHVGGLAYAPEASATDTQTWAVQHDLELVEISIEISSGDSANVPEIEMSASRSRSLTIDQVHVRAAEGAPAALRRRFSSVDETVEGSLVIESDGLSETLVASIEPALQDSTVSFAWSDEEEEWTLGFVDEDGEEAEGDESLLEGLVVDAHLGGLLDELGDESDAGARWEADPAALAALVVPAGHLGAEIDVEASEERGMEPVAAGLDPLLGMDLHVLLAGDADGDLDGAIACRLVEIEDTTAVIALDVDVTADRDVLDRVAPWVEQLSAEVPVEVVRAEATARFSGEGEVRWDVATGLPVAVSLELSIDYRLERDAQLVTPDGQELEITTTIDLEGGLSSTMSAE